MLGEGGHLRFWETESLQGLDIPEISLWIYKGKGQLSRECWLIRKQKNKKTPAFSQKSTLKINVKSHATLQTWSSARVERHGGSKSHSVFAGVWLLQWKSLLRHWGASVIFIHFIKKRIKTHEQRKTNSTWSLWDHRLLLLFTEMLQMGSLDNIIRFSFVCAEHYWTITVYVNNILLCS